MQSASQVNAQQTLPPDAKVAVALGAAWEPMESPGVASPASTTSAWVVPLLETALLPAPLAPRKSSLPLWEPPVLLAEDPLSPWKTTRTSSPRKAPLLTAPLLALLFPL